MKKIAVILALLSSSTASMAVTYNIGSLPIAPGVYTNTGAGLVGSFSDRYDFTFPALATTASGSAVSVSVTGLLNITGLSVALFTSGGSLIGTGSSAGLSSSLSNTPLASGSSYYYTVTGMAAPSGVYTFIASAAPVPEPETYALMLAGLGIVGFVAARRSNRV